MTVFSSLIPSLRRRLFFCVSDQELTEVDQIDAPEEFTDAECGAEEWKEMEEETVEEEKSTENEEKKEMSSSLQNISSLAEPILVKETSHPPTPAVTDIEGRPSVGGPVMFDLIPPTSTLRAGEIKPVIRALPSVGEPIRVYRTSRHLRPPTAELRLLPPMEEPSLADRIFPESMPPAGGMQTLPSLGEPLLVHEIKPTSVTDEVISLTSSASFQSSVEQKLMIQVDHHSQILPCSDVKPQPVDALLSDSTSQLVLMDIDIENEYVKYAGRIKTTRHQPLEAGMKPKRILCWMESDSEVQEPVPPIQVDEVQDFTDKDENDSEEEEFDSRKETDDAPEKARDRKIRLFHLNPFYRRKTETKQCLKSKQKMRNGPLALLDWTEKAVREREDKIRGEEKMFLERKLLLERYLNDPKLKHLWVNKHNCFNSFLL